MKKLISYKIQLKTQSKHFNLGLIIIFMHGFLYRNKTVYFFNKDSLYLQNTRLNFSYSYAKLSDPDLISQKRGDYFELGYAKLILPIDKKINYSIGTSIGLKNMNYQLPQPLYFGQMGVIDGKIIIGYVYATSSCSYQKKLKNWDYICFLFEPKIGISARLYSQARVFKDETEVMRFTYKPKQPSDYRLTLNYQLNFGIGYVFNMINKNQLGFILNVKLLANDATEKGIPYLNDILPSINLTYTY